MVGSTVTFNHTFIDSDGDCRGVGSQLTVENGKITLYDWGLGTNSRCE